MAKVWKDHPLYGRRLGYVEKGTRIEVEVVDVKPGPMLLDTSSLDGPEERITGTIKLKIKPTDGSRAAFWTAPMEYIQRVVGDYGKTMRDELDVPIDAAIAKEAK